MAYSDFTLRDVVERFRLTLEDVPDLFADAPEVEPGVLLLALLPEFLPLALAINTEKARSELVIAPLLAALRSTRPPLQRLLGYRVHRGRGPGPVGLLRFHPVAVAGTAVPAQPGGGNR